MWREWHPTQYISIVSSSTLCAREVLTTLELCFCCMYVYIYRYCFALLFLFLVASCFSVLCSHFSLLYLFLVCQTWRGLRMAVWECLSGTDLNSSFASDKQAMLGSLGSISTPRAIRYSHLQCNACVLSVERDHSDCLLFFSSHSVELPMERASSVSGRSTRHPPTQNPTW